MFPSLRRPGRPWGFWATLGWTVFWLVAAVASGMAVAMVLVLLVFAADAVGYPGQPIHVANLRGLLLGAVEILTAPLLVGLTCVLAWVRMPVADYLGLRPLRWRESSVCLLLLLVLIFAQDSFAVLVGRPIVPEAQVEAYRTAGFLPLLAAAVIIAAPLIEELYFRGFMYKGLAASKAGVVVAILLPAAVWALIHFQYDWIGRGVILADGIFLGLIRRRTGSVTVPILLHGVMNAVASVQTAVVAEGWA